MADNKENNSTSSNPLESTADSLAMCINVFASCGLQLASNIVILGSKAIWQVVELTSDVIGIVFRVVTGNYEYENNYNENYLLEVANTKENKLLNINKNKIEEYRTNAIDVEYLPLDPLIFSELPTKVKYKSKYGDTENTLKCYVGVTGYNKPLCIDFYEYGSLLTGGMSRWGKTSLILSMLTSLMERYNHNYLRIILVDYKMVDLTYLDEYEHVMNKCIVDNIKFYQMLDWVENQIKIRSEEFRPYKIQNIQNYNKRVKGAKMQPIIIVIDELAKLFNDLDETKAKSLRKRISSVLSVSMAFGIYWVVSTQELSRETLGKMKNNFGQRIGFKTADSDATDLIIKGAELHEIKFPGRAKLETSEGITEFQSYFIELEEVEGYLKDFKK